MASGHAKLYQEHQQYSNYSDGFAILLGSRTATTMLPMMLKASGQAVAILLELAWSSSGMAT